jgi:hypothetical protein
MIDSSRSTLEDRKTRNIAQECTQLVYHNTVYQWKNRGQMTVTQPISYVSKLNPVQHYLPLGSSEQRNSKIITHRPPRFLPAGFLYSAHGGRADIGDSHPASLKRVGTGCTHVGTMSGKPERKALHGGSNPPGRTKCTGNCT